MYLYMIICIMGSGGREHALCKKISQSPKVNKIYCIPGNAGTQEIAENVFGQMDLNNDEVVDRSEFEKSQISKMIRSFDALQPNAEDLLMRETFIGIFMKYHSKNYTNS